MVAVSLIIAALVAVAAVPSVHGLTIQEEKELSKEYMRVLRKFFEFIEDPIIVDYVNDVGQRILAKMPPQPFEYHFYVIKQDVFNAFATPAGHIFIIAGCWRPWIARSSWPDCWPMKSGMSKAGIFRKKSNGRRISRKRLMQV
jgi:hypothetical protein